MLTFRNRAGSAGVLTPCCRLQHRYVPALLALIGIRFAHWHQSWPWDPSQNPSLYPCFRNSRTPLGNIALNSFNTGRLSQLF